MLLLCNSGPPGGLIEPDRLAALQYSLIDTFAGHISRVSHVLEAQVGGNDHGPARPEPSIDDGIYGLHGVSGIPLRPPIIERQKLQADEPAEFRGAVIVGHGQQVSGRGNTGPDAPANQGVDDTGCRVGLAAPGAAPEEHPDVVLPHLLPSLDILHGLGQLPGRGRAVKGLSSQSRVRDAGLAKLLNTLALLGRLVFCLLCGPLLPHTLTGAGNDAVASREMEVVLPGLPAHLAHQQSGGGVGIIARAGSGGEPGTDGLSNGVKNVVLHQKLPSTSE